MPGNTRSAGQDSRPACWTSPAATNSSTAARNDRWKRRCGSTSSMTARGGSAGVLRRGEEALAALGDRDDRARLDEDRRGPDDLRPGRVSRPGGERLLEVGTVLVGREHVATLEPLPGAHPPGLEPQPRQPGEAGVRGAGDVVGERLLGAGR